MTKDANGRRYDSPRRREQSRETRTRLLDSAFLLFLRQGYSATSIPEIAREAGVAVPTFYWAFGSKRALLFELVSTRTVGDEDPVPLAQRPWWREMLAEPDPVRQLQRFAAVSLRLHARTADLFEILRGAAASDPEVAAVQREGSARRYQDVEDIAHSLANKEALRPGVSVEQAADLLWSMIGSDMYRLLVRERGWSPEEYERWETAALISFLLPDDVREGVDETDR